MVLIEENHNTNDAGIAGRFRQVGPGTTVSRNFNHGNWRGQSTGCRATTPSRMHDTSRGNVRVIILVVTYSRSL